jgi:hypothetical protein
MVCGYFFSIETDPEMANFQKPFLGGYPEDSKYQNSENSGHQVGPKDSVSQNLVKVPVPVLLPGPEFFQASGVWYEFCGESFQNR